MVKNQPAMQKRGEMWVRSLSWEDPLNEEVATHYYILALQFPAGDFHWPKLTRSQRGMQLMGVTLHPTTTHLLAQQPEEGVERI